MFGPNYNHGKVTKMPQHHAFRPVANEHDVAKQDSSMLAVASGIATSRGESDTLSKESVYRRMEQKQRININKFGDNHKSQKKLLNFYQKQMGGVYDSKQMSKMYGIYQDGEEKMFDTIRPMNLQKGDIVYNNLLGEIGVLQDNQDRGEDCILVFQDRSIRVNKAVSGWSKKLITTDESSAPPVAASSAAGPALFKEQIDSSQKNFVNDTMQKIIKEVDHQDDPHCLKNECEGMMKGMSAEKEHIDTAKKLFDHEITPSEAPFEIAKTHIEENKKYYSKFNPNSKGKEYIIKQDESDEDDFDNEEDEDEDEDGWNDDVEFADGGMSQRQRKAAGMFIPIKTGYAQTGIQSKPQLAKQQSNFPHEQFHALAKQHNVPVGSKMKVTTFDKNKNQDVTHFGTYKGPGKNIGIPNPNKYKPAQLHEHFNKSSATTIKTDSGSLTHFKPTPRFSAPETNPIPDVGHHDYFKGIIEKHKKTLENPHVSEEHKVLATEHIKNITAHLSSYKGEKGQHGPSESMAKLTQHENVGMHLLGKHPIEDIATTYSDMPTAHSKFVEKYKRNPEVIVHTMPRGVRTEIESVSKQEKETHMKQLSSANKPGYGAIGMNKTFSLGAKELTHKSVDDGGYAYSKNKFGVHQRTQMVAPGKAGSTSDIQQGTYHGIFEHKAFPSNLKSGEATHFVKQRQYEHGSKRFNLESPLKKNIQNIKEKHDNKMIGGRSKIQKQPEHNLGPAPTNIEKMSTNNLGGGSMGLSPAEIAKR